MPKEENQLIFTVYGNHESDTGNPIGYVRTTQRGKWLNQQYRRYLLYRDHINAAFLSKYPAQDFVRGRTISGHPIILEGREKVYCDIRIYFANRTHSDPDNVQKAFQDALFAPDKYVAGSFDFFYDKERPRVEVTIRF